MRSLAVLADGVVAIILLVLYLNPEKLIYSLYGLNVAIFVFSPILAFAALMLMSFRMKGILHVLNVDLKSVIALKVFALSNMMGHISPAKSGEFIKVYILKRLRKLPTSKPSTRMLPTKNAGASRSSASVAWMLSTVR